MPLTFTNAAKRDELGRRLIAIAEYMRRSMDQGHDGRIVVGEEMICDILTAAACVRCADVVEQ